MAQPTKTGRKPARRTNRITSSDGDGAVRTRLPATPKEKGKKLIVIPPLKQSKMKLKIIGDRPLLMNNKMGIAPLIAERYQGKGKAASVKLDELTPDEAYAYAFYVMPSSKYKAPHPKAIYGVPTSGIKKCITSAIRTTGITDNTTIGLIGKSFFILSDEGGLCQLHHTGIVKDCRPVNIGTGQKTVPNMRYRPRFDEWWMDLDVIFNDKILSEEQLVNLAMHAGQYIGLCELRAEKKQGECGGFVIG